MPKSGPFYQLSAAEWLKSINDLTHVELKLFYYILTQSPFGDSPVDCRQRVLQKKLSVGGTSISRALKGLEAKGYISVQIVSAVSQAKPKFFRKDVTDLVLNNQTGDIDIQISDITNQTGDIDIQISDITNQTGDISCPKPAPRKRSEVSQTNKTNKTNKTLSLANFLEPLSEEERESFLNFADSKIDLLQKPPALREKWIAKNWDELWREFSARPQTAAAAAAAAARSTIPQEGDPEFYSWLLTFWRCPQDLYDGAADLADRERRVEFSKWAQMEADFERILSPEDYGIEGLAG